MAGRGTDIQLGGNLEFRVADEHSQLEEGSPEYEAAAARIRAEITAEKAAVLEAGGLFVLGTERHESRRIDNQLRGRSGRQGDPGLSRFYLSLDDDLLRIFGPQTMFAKMMNAECHAAAGQPGAADAALSAAGRGPGGYAGGGGIGGDGLAGVAGVGQSGLNASRSTLPRSVSSETSSSHLSGPTCTQ